MGKDSRVDEHGEGLPRENVGEEVSIDMDRLRLDVRTKMSDELMQVLGPDLMKDLDYIQNLFSGSWPAMLKVVGRLSAEYKSSKNEDYAKSCAKEMDRRTGYKPKKDLVIACEGDWSE